MTSGKKKKLPESSEFLDRQQFELNYNLTPTSSGIRGSGIFIFVVISLTSIRPEVCTICFFLAKTLFNNNIKMCPSNGGEISGTIFLTRTWRTSSEWFNPVLSAWQQRNPLISVKTRERETARLSREGF